MDTTDLYQLWADFAGRCAFDKCKKYLFPKTPSLKSINIGERCHIVAQSPVGPRGKITQSELMKQDPENIILMCRIHHKMIDTAPDDYPEETLKRWRKQHIEWVANQLNLNLLDDVWNLFLIFDRDFQRVDSNKIKNEFIPLKIFKDELLFETEGRPKTTEEWNQKKLAIKHFWEDKRNNKSLCQNFSIYSITYIPYLVYFGFLVRDSSVVELHQFDRENKSWKYKKGSKSAKTKFYRTELTKEKLEKRVVLCVEISSNIIDSLVKQIFTDDDLILRIGIENQSRLWLDTQEKQKTFQKEITKYLDQIRMKCVEMKELHLLLAVPAPFAFIIGAALNPSMFPKVVTYNYFQSDKPAYTRAIDFNN